jgi:hypothetical protein
MNNKSELRSYMANLTAQRAQKKSLQNNTPPTINVNNNNNQIRTASGNVVALLSPSRAAGLLLDLFILYFMRSSDTFQLIYNSGCRKKLKNS